jgi:serine/threonine-protein kinase
VQLVQAGGDRLEAPPEALEEETTGRVEQGAEAQPRAGTYPAPGSPRTGALRVAADPWAVVVIDGDSVDLTPLAEPIALEPGTYTLQLMNPAFPPYETTIDVGVGDTLDHRVTFWDRVGLLVLEVSPWAEVRLDAVVQDTVPPQKRPFVIAPGWHDLSLRHPVLGVVDTTIQVAAGDTLRLRFNLDPRRR